jgi:hypothetical protein
VLNLNACGGKWSWPILRYYSSTGLDSLKNDTKTKIIIAGLRNFVIHPVCTKEDNREISNITYRCVSKYNKSTYSTKKCEYLGTLWDSLFKMKERSWYYENNIPRRQNLLLYWMQSSYKIAIKCYMLCQIPSLAILTRYQWVTCFLPPHINERHMKYYIKVNETNIQLVILIYFLPTTTALITKKSSVSKRQWFFTRVIWCRAERL